MLRIIASCLVFLALTSIAAPVLAGRHDDKRVIIVDERRCPPPHGWGHGHWRHQHRHHHRHHWRDCGEVRVRETVRVAPAPRGEYVREVWTTRPAW